MTAQGPLTVLVVAAEASGDSLGGGLIRALRGRLGGAIRFVGVGGAQMQAEGVDSPFDISELSVLGLLEGLAAYPRVRRRVRDVAALAAREQPCCAILIDSWGFTLRVAKALRAQSPTMTLIKYVAPQVWASRPGRAATLAASVDHLLSIHVFDAPYFQRVGLPSTFVGNAALSRDFSRTDPEGFRSDLGLSADKRIVLILPGSRPGEIHRMLPVFLEAARRLSADRPDLVFVLPVADTVRGLVEAGASGAAFDLRLVYGEAARFNAMKAAAAALACSGTVTTELALAGCPMVVAYRVGRLTHFVLKRLLTTRYATLFNIAADAEVAPERLQYDCTPEALALALGQRLDDPELAADQVRRQYAALDVMGRGMPDPADAAADAVVALLRARGVVV